MKLLSRALVALPCLSLTATLAAGTPIALKPGAELLLTPAGGGGSMTLLTLDATHTRVTLRDRTRLAITPDPSTEFISRQWVLPAGTELQVSLAPGQSLHRLDLAQSVALEVVSPDPGSGNKYPPTILRTESLTSVAQSASLTVDPDPGQGGDIPPRR